tara:strand:+ start:4467 stop:4727 length:261 start_codon:yes stop_codon:yes gene_type:complete
MDKIFKLRSRDSGARWDYNAAGTNAAMAICKEMREKGFEMYRIGNTIMSVINCSPQQETLLHLHMFDYEFYLDPLDGKKRQERHNG